jgi:hypothetical protein
MAGRWVDVPLLQPRIHRGVLLDLQDYWISWRWFGAVSGEPAYLICMPHDLCLDYLRGLEGSLTEAVFLNRQVEGM